MANPLMDGAEVIEHRVALGMNQTQLAASLGVGQGHVSRMERGKRNVPEEVRLKLVDMVLRVTGERICRQGEIHAAFEAEDEERRVPALSPKELRELHESSSHGST